MDFILWNLQTIMPGKKCDAELLKLLYLSLRAAEPLIWRRTGAHGV